MFVRESKDITKRIFRGYHQDPHCKAINVIINDIFVVVAHISIFNYADNTTIFACYPDIDTIVRQFDKKALQW